MTVHQNLGAQYQVQGFPTFKLFADGKVSDYNGQRTATAFVDAATSLLTKTAKARLNPTNQQQQQSSKSSSNTGSSKTSSGSSSSSSRSSTGSGGVVEQATDATFENVVLGNDNDLVIVSFTSPNCGWCHKLKPHFAEAAKTVGANSGIRFVDVDATVNHQLASRFQIQGFPTIKAFPPGPKSDSSAIEYQGAREAEALVEWATSTFQQYGGKIVMEVPEIVNQAVFESSCGTKKKCVMVFLPDILDSSAKERNEYIETVKAAASRIRHMPFVWVSANNQPSFESAYDLRSGFPAVILLREVDGQKVGFNFRGKLTEDSLVSFASAPRGLSQAVKGGWPVITKTTPWDGKDAPKPTVTADDGFDVSEFLKSQEL
jgi:protein disulfide-isomerase A6